MEDIREAARLWHEEGLRQAQLRLASLSPEERALAAAAETRLLSRFFRMFAGTEDMSESKGHVPCMILSAAEMREFRKTEPATHMWAAFEEKFLDLGDL